MSKKLAVETVILAQKVKELYEQCRYSEAIAPATELAVLSACETGLGDIQTGEGVFDLRRAFMLAGAKTLVMSLWSVPDEATKELMVDFYRRILAGEGRADALRNAQLAIKTKYPDPYYWGAFICQGDPGPLATAVGRSGAPTDTERGV